VRQEVGFDRACSLVEAALRGPARRTIVAEAAKSADLSQALRRLRDGMRSHQWKAGAHLIRLDRVLTAYDSQTRRDGFHVLHDWDGIADKVNDDSIPVDVLNYLIDQRGAGPADAPVLAILLDYYFLHVLALLSLRVWDDSQPDDHLDRLQQLLQTLQGPDGSGQQFAGNAETLLLLATSHYELSEHGYAGLLERVRRLNPTHRMTIALTHAASLGGHLRFGFEATYGKDVAAMRTDNVTDYPWLCFALGTLMRAYARLHDEDLRGAERDAIVEALLNGLSPDVGAFVGDPPASLSSFEGERSDFRDLFHMYRHDLLDEFDHHRPADQTYSPLSFFFNFSHNVLKGTVVDALLWGEPSNLSFNDLLTGLPREGPKGASRVTLAKTLMGYARANPHRIRGRLTPVIVYDPRLGRRAFGAAMRTMRA